MTNICRERSRLSTSTKHLENFFNDNIRIGEVLHYSETCLKRPLKEDPLKISKTNTCLMQVKGTAKCRVEHSAVLLNCIELPHVFNAFVLSISEWPLKTGFTI